MKKIIGLIQPFDIQPFDIYQQFYVYQDGNKIDMIQTKIQDIPDTIFELSQTYDINQIDLSGAEHFTKKIIQQIQAQEIIKYSENKLIIKCI